MGISFSADQEKVISLRNRNILVSAAAGSGKTTVLVERIIRMICDKENPVDIDRLLIVTFTNAAAASMREKISEAIAKKLEEEPGNEHLERQSSLLHNALITTIDSFCLFIVRNNFNEIGLDPVFRVADEGEIRLLKQEVMDAVVEECFVQDKDGKFSKLADRFITGNSTKGLSDVIFNLYEHAISFPFPIDWLEERKHDYDAKEDVNEISFVRSILDYAKEEIKRCREMTEANIEICKESYGPHMYLPMLQSDLVQLQQCEGSNTYAELQSSLRTFTFERLSGKKDDAVDPECRAVVQGERAEIKGIISDIKENYFSVPEELVLHGMQTNAAIVRTLCDVTRLFYERLQAEKREKKIIDFSDMEHFALEILLKKEDGKYVPTQTALDYRQYFKEIMIDEYQDSNMVQEYLLQTLSGEDEGNYNRFMVGDVKQSIYKFRPACPEIFMEKYDAYQKEDSKTQRIDLSMNYRSRGDVLDSVNFVFHKIMGKDLGNVEYNEDCALHLGAKYPDLEVNKTEFLLMEKEKHLRNEKEQEILLVATKIKELVGKYPVIDELTKEVRKARYSDIVVLLRASKSWEEDWKRIFDEEQIPVSVTTRTGYFAAKEVCTIMNFLRVIDNPKQDIPLYGVMKASFGGFKENEIAKLRALKKDNLYENLVLCAEEKAEGMPFEKCKEFLAFIQKYRDMVPYEPIHKMLRIFLKETGYLYDILAMPGGTGRAANVEMLLEKAENYEKSSFSGVFHFIRYMEQIQKYDVDYGEAATLDENANVVRIMTIHKSKGLEFPICILAGCSKSIQARDTHGALLCDTSYGVAFDYVDLENRIKYPDLRKNVLAKKMKEDEWGEQLRILYVAMTRAKEKLILTGMVNGVEKTEELLLSLRKRNTGKNRLSLHTRVNASSYTDWILAAISTESDAPIHLQLLKAEEIILQKITAKREKQNRKEKPVVDLSKLQTEKEALQEAVQFTYKHEQLRDLYVKTSVSELKMAAMHANYADSKEEEPVFSLFHDKEAEPVVPRFMESDKAVSGSARGTAYHRAMELFDFTKLFSFEQTASKTELIQTSFASYITEGLILKEEMDLVSVEKVERFLNHPIAQRIANAQKDGCCYKEQPFVLGIEANKLNPDFPKTEMVLIQGIIDLYFEEDGEIVLLDYKTDSVKTGEELVKRYKTQMDYYAEAIERILNKKVKEKLLYSFALETTIVV